jgi:hypothetical protein
LTESALDVADQRFNECGTAYRPLNLAHAEREGVQYVWGLIFPR